MKLDRILVLAGVILVVIAIGVGISHIIDQKKAFDQQLERSNRLQAEVDSLVMVNYALVTEAHRLLDPIPARVLGRQNVWGSFEADARRVNDHSGTYMDSSVQRLIDGIDGTRPFIPH